MNGTTKIVKKKQNIGFIVFLKYIAKVRRTLLSFKGICELSIPTLSNFSMLLNGYMHLTFTFSFPFHSHTSSAGNDICFALHEIIKRLCHPQK